MDKRRPKTGDAREGDWLQSRGFDGLYHPDPVVECGCVNADLRPCGDRQTPCRGGREDKGGAGIFQRGKGPSWFRRA